MKKKDFVTLIIKQKFKIFKMFIKILLSIILSIIIVFFSFVPIQIMAFANHFELSFVINVFVILIVLLVYTNWAIWSTGLLRKIFIPIFMVMALFIGAMTFPDIPELRSDYCIEDGDCEEGRIIYHNDKEILINKENCLKYNWEWNEKKRFCKVR